MFLLIAVIFMAVGAVHAIRTRSTRAQRVELVLVYLLAGYLGLVMVGVALFTLVHPEHVAAMLRARVGNPFQYFLAFAYLGLAVVSTLSIFLRGVYLVAPVVGWSVFFFGATWVHLAQYSAAGRLDHHASLFVILEHAVVPCLAIGLALWLRRLSADNGSPERPTP